MYTCSNDSGFQVLSDETSIIGILESDSKIIAKEHILDQSICIYNAAISEVNTLVINQDANMLLAGEDNKNGKGRVVQYDLDSAKVVKDYGTLNIGLAYSSVSSRSLCIFGGSGESSFIVIDMITKRVLFSPKKTGIKYIYSLELCKNNDGISNDSTVLVVAGQRNKSTGYPIDMFYLRGLADQYAQSKIDTKKTAHNDTISSNTSKQTILAQKVGVLQNQLPLQTHDQASEPNLPDTDLVKKALKYTHQHSAST